jgi:membrane protease YdiL (CAAX protease family)
MKAFAQKRPVLFEIILVIAAFFLAAAFGVGGQAAGFENEFSMAIGRILTGILLLIIFRGCLKDGKQFSGLIIMLPALGFALWNVANHFITKGDFSPLTAEILILGLAPAIFEEVIFRGIFIHNLRASGKSDIAALLIPALLFGLIHLTNAVNGNIAQALVQTGYAVVVGLVFGAIYIRTGDLFSVILAHAAIDITNRVFMGATVTPTPVIIGFVVLLAIEAAYAFVLVSKGKNAVTGGGELE